MLVLRDNVSNRNTGNVVSVLGNRASIGNFISDFDFVGGALESGGTGAGDALEAAHYEDGAEPDVQSYRMIQNLIRKERAVLLMKLQIF